MIPHKLTCLLFLIVALQSTSFAQNRRPPAGGRLAIVVDERLAALRASPQLTGKLVRRLSRGRMVAIRSSKTGTDGITFFLVNVTSRTRGWIQREAVASPSRAGDDRRLLAQIERSQGFDRISRARIFLDHFPRSPLRPKVLLLLGDAAEEISVKLSKDAARRLNGNTGDAPEFSYYLNHTGLDRYNRLRVGFVFDQTTKRLQYDGAAWRELIRRHPKTPEALEARKRIERALLATANSVSCAVMKLKPQGEFKMGLTHVRVKVWNRDSEDSFITSFLVDTGSWNSMVPASVLRKLSVKPAGKEMYELANGERQEYEYGIAFMSFMDEIIATRVIFGPDDVEPLLGVVALESAGFIVDPRNQTIKKLEAIPLKIALPPKIPLAA